MNLKFIICLLLSFPLLLGSCHHKDLIYDASPNLRVRLVFDWQNAPDASPESMAAYFFPVTTSLPIDYEGEAIRFIFPDISGGTIRLPFGYFAALGMNSDNTDWAVLRNAEGLESFEVCTGEAESLAVLGVPVHSLPRKEGSNERIVKTPGMTWGCRTDDILLRPSMTDAEKEIVLYPEERVCHYTVDIYNVKNLQYLTGEEVDASLSGMAEGHVVGKNQASATQATMSMVMTKDLKDSSLHSEFLTFGVRPDASPDHILKVYTILEDGSKWIYNADVTDQVAKAPDPQHVHIVLRSLEFPQPIVSGGLVPDVDEWQSVNIDIKM
ncbi:MAG: DUF5119 domain-containing protein [Muribaculaceae bacterium]|nr:DUF5119 domain-containing protein [Muribaculaceae bacterium]